MQVIPLISPCSDSAKGAVIALGNFDGVHLGHTTLIEQTKQLANEYGCPSAVMTFDPHPAEFFNPAAESFRLTPKDVKENFLAQSGLNYCFVGTFDKAFSELSAHDFVAQILAGVLQCRHVVIGRDFIFGHKRQGNSELLKKLCAELNIGFTQIEPVGDGELVFSSSQIRQLIREGNVSAATHILGKPHRICGTVGEGLQQGRLLGFPTANLSLEGYLLPKFGVYRVKAAIDHADHWLDGIANIGQKPTYGDEFPPLLEVHLFDFCGNIYNHFLQVQLIEFVRNEQSFESIDHLKEAIRNDVEYVKGQIS